jgi:hypothetical protein
VNKINYEERAKVYSDARDTFGANAQLAKALEELNEVQLELCRFLTGRGNVLHLAEEVADATIMLEQVRQIFDINALVCDTMDRKVLRLQQRIEDTKNTKARTLDDLRRLFGKDEVNG